MVNFTKSIGKRGRFLIAVTLIAALLVWTGDRWLIHPPEGANPTEATDAVMVHAGGSGERLDRALELIDAGVATNLVMSPAYRNGQSITKSEWNGQLAVIALCEEPPAGITVTCVSLGERSTRGEARAFGQLAGEMGWDKVTLVTGTHHLHRATLRLSRCFDGEINPVAVQSPAGYLFWGHEYLGNLEAYLLERAC